MSVVKYEDLKVGCIYVTKGGTVTLPDNKTIVGWGYDRVKVIKKFTSPGGNQRILIQTPWGTECDIPWDYPLEETTEKFIKSEFELISYYVNKKIIPFNEAVELGICKEEDTLLLSESSESQTNDKISVPRARKSTTEANEFMQKVIDFFSEPKEITDAVKHFKVEYQKIRYTIMDIKQKGFNLDRFDLNIFKKTKRAAMYQLVKVEKY